MLLWKYFAVTVYYRSTFSGSILDILSKPNSISQTALIKKTAELLRKKKKMVALMCERKRGIKDSSSFGAQAMGLMMAPLTLSNNKTENLTPQVKETKLDNILSG